MTARDIQRRLIVDRYRRSFVLHNYTPAKWWECDVFECTKAGYFREYEIKITRGDFNADAKKRETLWIERSGDNGRWGFDRQPGRTKHSLLQQRSTDGPSQFWFVSPMGVIMHDELPEWAGLIWCHANGNRPPFNIRFDEVVRAPNLHRNKLADSVLNHARGVCYYRLHNLFCNPTQCQSQAPALKQQI